MSREVHHQAAHVTGRIGHLDDPDLGIGHPSRSPTVAGQPRDRLRDDPQLRRREIVPGDDHCVPDPID